MSDVFVGGDSRGAKLIYWGWCHINILLQCSKTVKEKRNTATCHQQLEPQFCGDNDRRVLTLVFGALSSSCQSAMLILASDDSE